MYKHYFPTCKVEGAIEPPIPFNHMGIAGAVPNKCGSCKHLFEGGCTRYIDIVGAYLHLDYGPCTINGPTDPVVYEDRFVKGKVEVPRKCSTCFHLKVDVHAGFYCTQDESKWGAYHRGLDWGSWEPDSIHLQLPLPKVTTRQLSIFVKKNDIVGFIKEYRRINPGLSINEAKSDFGYLQHALNQP
jgi:hypothetical protein